MPFLSLREGVSYLERTPLSPCENILFHDDLTASDDGEALVAWGDALSVEVVHLTSYIIPLPSDISDACGILDLDVC